MTSIFLDIRFSRPPVRPWSVLLDASRPPCSPELYGQHCPRSHLILPRFLGALIVWVNLLLLLPTLATTVVSTSPFWPSSLFSALLLRRSRADRSSSVFVHTLKIVGLLNQTPRPPPRTAVEPLPEYGMCPLWRKFAFLDVSLPRWHAGVLMAIFTRPGGLEVCPHCSDGGRWSTLGTPNTQ